MMELIFGYLDIWSRFNPSPAYSSYSNCATLVLDDLEKFDGEAPILTLLLDILCELLDTSDGWLTKEPTLRILKLLCPRWEHELQVHLTIHTQCRSIA